MGRRKNEGIYRPSSEALSRMTEKEFEKHRDQHPPKRKRRNSQSFESLGRMTPKEFTSFTHQYDPQPYGIHAKNIYGEK